MIVGTLGIAHDFQVGVTVVWPPHAKELMCRYWEYDHDHDHDHNYDDVD